MRDKDLQYFELLKKEIVRTLKQSFPGVSDRIEEWKGQTILFLQEDILDKAKENISEKWFYNHMKTRTKKLPRVDMLNLLSRYSGYADWQDFTFKNQAKITSFIINDKSNRMFVIVPLLVITILAVFYLLFKILSTKEYQFCFVSWDDFSAITSSNTQIEIISDNESPMNYICDTNGCFKIKTDKRKISFVVSSPYYKTDTIKRVLKKFNRTETVSLETNDYALMIHYFSTANVSDWQKRRQQLDKMFADSVRIFEVFNKGILGMELYDKWEFINKLTVPSQSLRQIEVLDTDVFKDQIVILRFTRQKDEI